MARPRKIKRYHYGSLNRRRRRGNFFKTILFLLLLALLIFLGYCAAKSIGDLSARSSDPSSSQPPESSLASAIQSQPDEDSSIPESSAESQPEAQTQVRAVVMPPESATDLQKAAAFLEGLDPAEYNTVTVDLKDADGQLAYQSAVPLAANCGAVPAGAMTLEQLNELADAIRDAGFVPAARIYTLQDDYASHATYSTSYLYENQAGVTWLDQAADKGGRSWLNPYMPAAREYLDAITSEIAAAGFERIFAAGLQYPDTRFPQQMGYGPDQASMSLTEALQLTLDGMETAAAKENAVVIPIYQGEGYLGEKDALYGGSPAAIDSDSQSPILPEGREAEVLAAVDDTADIIPVIRPAQQSLLEQNQINQYLVEAE